MLVAEHAGLSWRFHCASLRFVTLPPFFPQDGRFQVELPRPSFQQLKEKLDDSGIRSPKYPSTVTKVRVRGHYFHYWFLPHSGYYSSHQAHKIFIRKENS